MKTTKISFEAKKKWIGFMFVVPWLIGFINFFFIPIINSIRFSISKIMIDNGPIYEYLGFTQYKYLFLSDATFFTDMLKTSGGVFLDVLMVIVFSLFFSLILVQKFRGRLLARAMFFLPVIVASGAVIKSIRFDASASGQFELSVLQSILQNANLSNDLVGLIVRTMEQMFQIIWKCGIQILIFMAGLQSIPSTIKEAAYVEGATGWEYFWKITFPMVMPLIQLNIIYTIIDSFTDYTNPIIQRIYALNQQLDYSFSSTIAWSYFSIIFIIAIVLYMILGKLNTRNSN